MTNYYAGWVDQEIPALGGRTPRHAARLKTQRPKVAALLRPAQLALKDFAADAYLLL